MDTRSSISVTLRVLKETEGARSALVRLCASVMLKRHLGAVRPGAVLPPAAAGREDG